LKTRWAQTFSPDAVLNTFSSAHNIAINESTGYAYVIGARVNGAAYYSGGPVFIDINTPAAPQEVGGYSGSSLYPTMLIFVTLSRVQTPDYPRVEKSYFGSNSDGGENNKGRLFLDVTDKSAPPL
jgi:hypothetical protein